MRTLLGASLQRPDAVGKVNGAAAYPADLVRPGMLHLKVVFAQRPHARIRDIDPSAALRHPGVVAVLTAADVPYNAYGLIDADQPVLCGDVVRFEGDKVALVVAEGKAAAAEGARLVAVDRYAAIGGAFGGREDLSIQHLLALATWKLRRPTALVWSPEESIVGHHKRHPMSFRCRWAVTRDGKITAVEAEVIADGGAYASTSVEVVKVATLFSSGCYEVPNVALDGCAVYTNNVPCGAFRGFGAPQAQFAAELMVTRLAHALGLDPVELRRRNIYREGSIEPTQQPLPAGVSALPVLERCVEEARARLRYDAPRRHPAPHRRRGIGIACGMKNVGYSFGFPEQCTATVELFGRAEYEQARVRIGAADVGQGAHLILRQIAAEALELPIEKVEMVCDDSSQTPNAGSASASRLTQMAGRAICDAVADARKAWWDGAQDIAFESI